MNKLGVRGYNYRAAAVRRIRIRYSGRRLFESYLRIWRNWQI